MVQVFGDIILYVLIFLLVWDIVTLILLYKEEKKRKDDTSSNNQQAGTDQGKHSEADQSKT